MYSKTHGTHGVPACRFVARIVMLSYGLTATPVWAQSSTDKTSSAQTSLSPQKEKKTELASQSQSFVIVNGTRQPAEEYFAHTNYSALKIPVSIQKTPASVQVITHAVIQDRGALSINQAIETVSGVERNLTFPNSLTFRVRGFVDASTTLRDGFREQTGTQDIQGVDNIEVLKGPASVLYGGSTSSGGTVNVTTKRAIANHNFLNAGLSGGSFGLFRGTADGNRDLSGDGKIVGRINFAYQHDDTFRDFGYNETTYVAPTVQWTPSLHDKIDFFASWQLSNYTWGASQTPLVRKALALPLSYNFDNQTLGASHQNSWRLGYNWVHKFSDSFRFRSGFASSINNYNLGTDRMSTFSLSTNGQTLSRGVSSGPQMGKDFDLQNELSGTFHTGPLKHDWLVGSELYQTDYSAKTYAASLPALVLTDPVYTGLPGLARLRSNISTQAEAASVYFQDYISIFNRFYFLGGGRYDATTTSSLNKINEINTSVSANKFSPRLGILYTAGKTTSLYFNWSTSFIPTSTSSFNGTPLSPGRSRQIEAGIKQQLFHEHIQATVAVYDIRRSNVATTDPAHPLYSIAVGQQRSRGIEADVAGEILPGWKAVLSYAYTFANVTRDNKYPVGSVLAGVAKHTGNVWTTYEFADGTVLHGLGLGLGIRAATRREATLPNSFYLPGYFRLDSALWYKFSLYGRPVRAQLNMTNLTNAQIYDTNGTFSMRAEAPRSALGSLQVAF